MPRPLRGRIGSCRVAVLTVTPEEFLALRDCLETGANLVGTEYYVREMLRSQEYDVVVRRASGQTNLLSAEATGDFIEDFRPEFIFLVGTAGGHSGRDELCLGDVVVADFIDYSGYVKYKDGQVLARKNPHDHPSLYLRQKFAEPLRTDPEAWRQRINCQRPDNGEPKVLIGGLVAGDILMGDAGYPEQRRILSAFDKALAFEMEAVGVARAVFKSRSSVHYNPQFMVVRGISDLVDRDAAENQATREAWTPYAVATAGAFTQVLVDRVLGAPQPSFASRVTIREFVRTVLRRRR